MQQGESLQSSQLCRATDQQNLPAKGHYRAPFSVVILMVQPNTLMEANMNILDNATAFRPIDASYDGTVMTKNEQNKYNANKLTLVLGTYVLRTTVQTQYVQNVLLL